MLPGERFSFVCDQTMAGRMDRVVTMADGTVLRREKDDQGVHYTVART